MSLTVLLVEDDPELRATLREALQVEGYQVLPAASLADARALLSHAQRQAPSAGRSRAVDIALPGVLPVLNREAVVCAIKLGLAIGGTIAPRSIFARKNYLDRKSV